LLRAYRLLPVKDFTPTHGCTTAAWFTHTHPSRFRSSRFFSLPYYLLPDAGFVSDHFCAHVGLLHTFRTGLRLRSLPPTTYAHLLVLDTYRLFFGSCLVFHAVYGRFLHTTSSHGFGSLRLRTVHHVVTTRYATTLRCIYTPRTFILFGLPHRYTHRTVYTAHRCCPAVAFHQLVHVTHRHRAFGYLAFTLLFAHVAHTVAYCFVPLNFAIFFCIYHTHHITTVLLRGYLPPDVSYTFRVVPTVTPFTPPFTSRCYGVTPPHSTPLPFCGSGLRTTIATTRFTAVLVTTVLALVALILHTTAHTPFRAPFCATHFLFLPPLPVYCSYAHGSCGSHISAIGLPRLLRVFWVRAVRRFAPLHTCHLTHAAGLHVYLTTRFRRSRRTPHSLRSRARATPHALLPPPHCTARLYHTLVCGLRAFLLCATTRIIPHTGYSCRWFTARSLDVVTAPAHTRLTVRTFHADSAPSCLPRVGIFIP